MNRLAPQAPGLPLLGNAIAFLRDPLGFLRSTCERYGDAVRVSLGPIRMTLLSHPRLVEEVLVGNNKAWQKDHFLRTRLRPIVGRGLLSSDGDFWRRQRRLAQPAFHRDRIVEYGAIMIDRTSALIEEWRRGPAVRDVHRDMMRLTLEIVAEALFGADVSERAPDVGVALDALLASAADPLQLMVPAARRIPTPKRSRFRRALAQLDALIFEMIEQRRSANLGTRTDLLSMLLDAVDEDGSRMSDEQLRDECMTLFLAGHETTALNLSWTLLLLSEHPAVTATVVTEVRETIGDRLPTAADVPRLATTAMVLAESLRLYPPAWSMGRQALEAVPIGDFVIPRGEHAWFCPWSIHRDARWFRDPNSFRPERWAGDLAKTLPRFAYFPFGGGPRLCIGRAFAEMEATLVLAMLVRAFRIEVSPDPAPVPDPSVTLRPKHGVLARISRRD